MVAFISGTEVHCFDFDTSLLCNWVLAKCKGKTMFSTLSQLDKSRRYVRTIEGLS
jgi:hypothetical protein